VTAPLGPVRYLTIHCAATPEGRDNKADEVRKWDVERFGQASYHWVIELSGNAVRHLKDTEKGVHVAKANSGNIGICYVGGCDKQMKPKDTRTAAQKRKLAALVTTYRELFPGIIVRGHNEWPGVSKACPSFDVSKWLDEGMPC
jgi:N-acetylmuramoyl-L-alanine amidase